MANRRGNHSDFGQANPTVVGATGRRVVTTPGTGKRPLSRASMTVRETGTGAYVTSVYFDEAKQELVVRRGEPVEGSAADGMRVGVTKTTISHLADPTDLPTVDYWVKPGSGGVPIPEESLLLPSDFIHDDGFDSGNPWVDLLPDGLGWVRLGEGSAPAGEARWDADVIDTYAALPEGENAPKRPSLLRAWVTSAANPASIVLVFNTSVAVPDQHTYYAKHRFVVTSNKSGELEVVSLSDGPTANSVEITLARGIPDDERVQVRVKDRAVFIAGGVEGNRESSPIPAVVKYPRNCYVPVINRFRDGSSIAAGSRVVLGQPFLLRDSQGAEFPVYDIIEVGSAAAQTYLKCDVVAARTIIGSLKGCPFLDGVLEEVAQAWNPTENPLVQTFEDGVGVAQPWGQPITSRILIINDAAHSLFGHDLPGGEHVDVVIGNPVVLPVTGTDPVEYITLYPVRLP